MSSALAVNESESFKVVDETDRSEFKVQFKDISKRTPAFVDNVKHFTTDIKEVLVSRFVDYMPVKSLEYINFADRRINLQKENEELQSMIDKMIENNSVRNPKFQALYEEFLVTNKRFKFISDLGHCSKELEVSSRFIERHKYKEASEKLENLIEILNQPDSYKDLSELVDFMKDAISFKHVKCLYRITEQWRERLKWSESATNKGQLILVEINISDPENLQDILNALFSSKRINVELMRFADFVTKTLMPTLLTKGCSVNTRENLHKILIEIEYKENSKENIDINAILKNLTTFFETVQSNIDCRWEDGRTVFSILGQIVGEDFFRMLKENCLQNLVTTEECEVDTYLPIAAEIEKFSNYLCDIRFTDKETSPLNEFIKDTCNLICEKRCRVILGEARNLMKTNLQQDIVEVCVDQTSELCIDEMKLLEKDNYQGRSVIECPYLLPRCSISLSAKKILQLVVEQLDLAHSFTPALANKTIVTVRNIFELYYALVPTYHEDVLSNNALDLALFYNNCFYLAHGMLGHPWSKVYQPDYAARITALLADQVQNMRRVAIVKLSTFVREQRQAIKDVIEKSDLRDLTTANSLDLDSDDMIEKCLEILERLQRLWQPILPSPVYKKTMANLVCCLSEELVQVVLTVKENVIGEELARSVANLYKPALHRVPGLFSEQIDLEKLSRKWLRFVEMVSLLTSPMFSIACRWKKEDGHLSKHFTCDEIVHLVRILFPGGKHKSTVLDMLQGN